MSHGIIKATPDIFPQLSFDTRYGKYVDSIDVDVEKVVQQLREGGLSDEEILNLRINFSTDPIMPFDKSIVGLYKPQHNRPRKSSERVYVAYPDLIKGIQKRSDELGSDQEYLDGASRRASNEYSSTLGHELEHAIAARDTEQKLLNKEYRPEAKMDLLVHYIPSGRFSLLFAAMLVGAGAYIENGGDRIPIDNSNAMFIAAAGTAVALNGLDSVLQRDKREYSQYRNHPEEKRARAAGAAAPDDLVSIVMKKKSELGPKESTLRAFGSAVRRYRQLLEN